MIKQEELATKFEETHEVILKDCPVCFIETPIEHFIRGICEVCYESK